MDEKKMIEEGIDPLSGNVVRHTDNGLKPSDPKDLQPPQYDGPLELNDDGIPVFLEGAV